MKKIGLIINPVAGIGGRAGLKGSDGEAVQRRAFALGARPQSGRRAVTALRELAAVREDVILYSGPGEMGEAAAREAGFQPVVLHAFPPRPTTPSDTIDLAREMAAEGLELILFAGGDGTARDVYAAVGAKVPVLGVPAGVKLHSAVYAVHPRGAGQAASAFCRDAKGIRFKEAEVMDIDEEAFRAGRVEARLYGYMRVPELKAFMQAVKSGGYSEHNELLGLAAGVAASMEDGVYYIIGPGTTTRAVMEALELPATLLGVDVVRDRKLVASDVNERELYTLISGRPARIIVTAIGGQGHIFGRGNQQLSPRILYEVGKDRILVAATRSKLFALEQKALWVDTGDVRLDESLCGYVRVWTGFEESVMFPVRC
jgi:predicted polyphosphate/ATP-dependent NAD kinase